MPIVALKYKNKTIYLYPSEHLLSQQYRTTDDNQLFKILTIVNVHLKKGYFKILGKILGKGRGKQILSLR